MHFSIKNLVKSSAVYSIGQWATIFLGVILIPVYTRIFSPGDYGVIDLIGTTTLFLVMALQLGMDDAVTRFFCDTESEEEKARVATSAAAFKLLTYIPVLCVGILLSKEISSLIFGTAAHARLIAWSLATVFTTGFYVLFLHLLRCRFKTVSFAVVSSLQFLAQLLLTVYFVVWLRTGIVGIYWASIISMGPFAILLLFLNGSYMKARLNGSLLKTMFLFGIPTVPSSIAYWFMQNLDKYFINYYRGIGEVGVYGIGYKAGMVLLMVTAGFNMAWGPYVYSSFNKPGSRQTMARALNYYNSIMTTVAVGIALFAVELIRIFTTPQYYGAARVVGIVAFGLLIYQVTDYFCVGIGIAKKMHIRMWSGLVAVATNCLLNWLLIPTYGMVGAAWATLISYAVYGAIVMIGSEVSFHIPYAYMPNLVLWLIGGGIVALERLWLSGFPVSPATIGLKAALLAAFFLLTFGLKLIPSYVIRAAVDAIKGRNRKSGPQG